ncbi:hypothetical protein SAMN02745206_00902 [Desulfacinum infernum DSM 9756]|uniref:Uncharacterized protein n=1 Tax=Desulfacinum infernum DSM 9756 TaxID=1121391 RepID=A0A1M4WM02_9BACT|nr:hypothetical protein [Desulfacinum infernum]SHE82258.1 hypothetical protein SAMN02745206_00902 [Desulfacinum infernum DSM 9756]
MVGIQHTIRIAGPPVAARAPVDPRPLILQYGEADCIPRLLETLRREDPGEDLARATADSRTEEKVLRLFQPVHRVFHVVLVHAACTQPGEPRLDPDRVEKAGVVVRRVTNGRVQGWMRRKESPVGWVDLPQDAARGESSYDPDPLVRKERLLGANLRLLSKAPPADLLEEREEVFLPLFAAPPDVCRIQKKTFFYGILTLTSDEAAPGPGAAPFNDALLAERIPRLLKAGDGKEAATRTTAEEFLNLLRFLERDAGAFTGSQEGRHLLKVLQAIPMPAGSSEPTVGAVVEKAHREVERGGEKDLRSVPAFWPVPNSKDARAIERAVKAALTARWRDVAPRRGRFDEEGARYQIRVFLRIKGENGWPCRTVWSPPSESFRIVPWYESSGQPPVQVSLPALDKKALSRLKPNVAFRVPSSLRKSLEKLDMGELLDGSHEEGSGNFGMICGFNIPILTLCAFIVLQIFLVLLHIVFFWLPFVRICIPFPDFGSGSDSET